MLLYVTLSVLWLKESSGVNKLNIISAVVYTSHQYGVLDHTEWSVLH